MFGRENTAVGKHDVFTLYLINCDESYSCHLKILSRPVICVLPTMPAVHLKELIDYKIPINDNYKDPIEILIGGHVTGKIITDDYKSLPSGFNSNRISFRVTIMGPPISSEKNEILVTNSMLSTTRTNTNCGFLTRLTLPIHLRRKLKTFRNLPESISLTQFISTMVTTMQNIFPGLPIPLRCLIILTWL